MNHYQYCYCAFFGRVIGSLVNFFMFINHKDLLTEMS